MASAWGNSWGAYWGNSWGIRLSQSTAAGVKAKPVKFNLRDLGDIERQSTADFIKARLAETRQKVAVTDDVNLTVKGAKNAKSNLREGQEKAGTNEYAEQKRQKEILMIVSLIAAGAI
jgi:hypothetical protein